MKEINDLITTEVEVPVEVQDDSTIEALPQDEKKLTEEEKHELHVQQLKNSNIKFHPLKHQIRTVEIKKTINDLGIIREEKIKEVLTNVTINSYGRDFHKKKRAKNKSTKASRKVNRK